MKIDRKTKWVNTLCFAPGQNLYLFWAGEAKEVKAYLWADNPDKGFEEFAEWLDDNAPGHLYSMDKGDVKEAAEELNLLDHITEDSGEIKLCWDRCSACDKIREKAEEGLTIIGHTTLKHGQYIISHHWGFDEYCDGYNPFEAVAKFDPNGAEVLATAFRAIHDDIEEIYPIFRFADMFLGPKRSGYHSCYLQGFYFTPFWDRDTELESQVDRREIEYLKEKAVSFLDKENQNETSS